MPSREASVLHSAIDRWRGGTATLRPLLLSLAALMGFTLSGALMQWRTMVHWRPRSWSGLPHHVRCSHTARHILTHKWHRVVRAQDYCWRHPGTVTGVPLARLKFGANWDKIIIAHRNRRSSAAGQSPHEEQDNDGGSVKMRSAGAFG